MIAQMDPSFGAADEVPALYRSILSLIQELERHDRRREAGRIREEAIAAYSGSWDPRHRRRLERIEARLKRAVQSERDRGRPRWRLS